MLLLGTISPQFSFLSLSLLLEAELFKPFRFLRFFSPSSKARKVICERKRFFVTRAAFYERRDYLEEKYFVCGVFVAFSTRSFSHGNLLLKIKQKNPPVLLHAKNNNGAQKWSFFLYIRGLYFKALA